MKSLRWLYLLTLCLLFQSYLSAQEKLNIKFGKITASDVDLTHAKFDSSANALVISDIGNTNFEGDEEGGFYVIFKRFLREKIRNKNGLAIGLFKIPIHLNPSDRNFETAEVRGITYNLESGILVQTVLDPSSIYLDHYNKYIDLKVFRMPAAKEGSVLDVEYTIKSKYIESLEPW